jgi:hypothetical protein
VSKVWSLECKVSDPMEIWQFGVRSFRRVVRGWANNVVAEMNKYKQIVVVEFNHLDLEVENRMLDRDERHRMKELAKELDQISALEEIRAGQRSRDRNILEGGSKYCLFSGYCQP